MLRHTFKEAIVSRSELFSALSPSQWETVKKESTIIHLKRDMLLFAQRDHADRFFLLAQGLIKLSLLSEEGQEKVLRIIKPGQTFGEALMFLKKSHFPVHAIALQNSEVYAFKNEVFLRVLRESQETMFHLLGLLSVRLQSQLQEIDGISLQNATHRFIRYLLEQIPEIQHGEARIALGIPKQVLASHISVQPASLSRMLRVLSEKGLIHVQGGTINIPDVCALREQHCSCP